MISRSLRKPRITVSVRMARRMAASLALLAGSLAGSFAGEPARPFTGLPLPPGYRPTTPPDQRSGSPDAPAAPPRTPAPGVINPNANRPPITSAPGQVLYFHKPAGSATVTSDRTSSPASTEPYQQSSPPSQSHTLPPTDYRLAQLPSSAPPSPSVAPYRPAPDFSHNIAPVAYPHTPSSTVLPHAPQMVHTVQKQVGDLGKLADETPEQREARLRAEREKATRLPARDKIFVLYDDAQLEQAIIASVKRDVMNMKRDPGTPTPVIPEEFWKFPELSRIVPEGTVYQPKTSQYPQRTECYEPAWVVHRRLHFEQKNFERGGWDLGIVQPLVSTLTFYKDVLFWPHSLASGVHNCWDTSAGKCLPGSPTPFYLYPPDVTVTGTLAEAGLVTATVFIFP